jgi:uncharacterized protein DUF4395
VRRPGVRHPKAGDRRWTVRRLAGIPHLAGAFELIRNAGEFDVKSLFSFPNPVNEVSARLVAAGVVLLTIATIVFVQPVLLVLLAYGFVARVATGPTLSPLGQFVTRVLTPNLPFAPKYVAGPPKRFAQGIGAVLSVGAVIAYFGFGQTTVALVLVGLITVAATLESVFALCLGCTLFALLMRAGLISDEVCERCNNIWGDTPVANAAS